ncbi:DUF3159 domain-containing protein [Cryptosporangium sp. NPDC051539]|uniref:DUF3159 domain-containing protein n=1 Tax=Cryptosporangium sp. NPDC051539 TaxID=3363962 RepID=UPI003799C8DB
MTDHRARPSGDRTESAGTGQRQSEDETLEQAVYGDDHPSNRVADIIAEEAAELVADVPPGDPAGYGRHAAPPAETAPGRAVPAHGGSPRRVKITPPEAPDEVRADDDEQPLSIADQVRDQLGGIRGLVESSLPVLVFVLVNMATSLKPALWAAVGSAALIAGYRLLKRDSVRHALNGLFAVGIAALIAARTGQAEDFYLLNIARNSGGALVCAGSVLIRRPVIGYAWRFIAEIPAEWRDRRPIVRAFNLITLVWALMFAIRAAVQIYLWLQHNADALGWASLAMGWPMFGACLLFTVWYGRRAIAAEADEPVSVRR